MDSNNPASRHQPAKDLPAAAGPPAPNIKSSCERLCRAVLKQNDLRSEIQQAERDVLRAAKAGTFAKPRLVEVDGRTFTVTPKRNAVAVQEVSAD